MDDFKTFTDLMGSLIAKYADKIDLDSLPDVPKYVGTENKDEGIVEFFAESLASQRILRYNN